MYDVCGACMCSGYSIDHSQSDSRLGQTSVFVCSFYARASFRHKIYNTFAIACYVLAFLFAGRPRTPFFYVSMRGDPAPPRQTCRCALPTRGLQMRRGSPACATTLPSNRRSQMAPPLLLEPTLAKRAHLARRVDQALPLVEALLLPSTGH